jgi:hypothetical protein
MQAITLKKIEKIKVAKWGTPKKYLKNISAHYLKLKPRSGL